MKFRQKDNFKILSNAPLNTDFPSQFCVFLPQNHLALLKYRFLKKNALKKSKSSSPFLRETIGSNNSFTRIENIAGFLR